MAEETLNFGSLMDLASLDTSDMQALMSRLAKQGIYVIDLTKLGFIEQAPSDPAQPMSYVLQCAGLIQAFAPLDPAEPGAAEMEGKELNERYFLYGPQLKEAIQLMMGRFKAVGLRHKGIIGGVEGSAPGWIDEGVGKRIVVRVRHYTPKDGAERAAYDWLSPKQMEKAQIPWEAMQRPFYDEHGKEIDAKQAA